MKKIMDKNENKFKDRHKIAVENALDEKLIWKNIKTQKKRDNEDQK